MESVLDLQEIHLDALREIANMGAGNAATALHQMTGQSVRISIPEVHGVANAQLPHQLLAGFGEVAVVSMSIMGDLNGYAALIMAADDVGGLCARLMGTEEPALEEGRLTAMGWSTLQEVGNILVGAYLNALASFMEMSLLPSLPHAGIFAPADALKGIGEDAGSIALCAATEFAFEASDPSAGGVLRSQFLHLPDETSLQAIFRAINVT